MAWREVLVLSFLLSCGFVRCQKEGPPSGVRRYMCKSNNKNYDCIFRNVFIDNLNNAVLFGHANEQRNNQLWLTFVNSKLRSLPRSLLDTFTNAELLNLQGLLIETIERNALANGGKIKELYLDYNKISSLDAGVFDSLHSLELLMMAGNSLSSLPSFLFRNTTSLRRVSMASNKLQRIEDDTFRHNANLKSVNVASNRLTHFDLSLIPSLKIADVGNNQLQKLKFSSTIVYVDASNNQIHSVDGWANQFSIVYLYLSHNKLNTTAWLTPLLKLQSLDLSFNEIEDIASTDLRQLAELNTLKLNNNRLFTFVMQTSQINSLKTLDLSHNRLIYVKDNLKPFGMLEELYLDHNSIVTVSLETQSKLRNLTLSHNDWDCVSLANLSSRLPATTVVDYETETHCKEYQTQERGICCTVSERPYYDRLLKYMAEVSVYEKLARSISRCTGADTVHDTANNVSSSIVSNALPVSTALANEVQALKSDVQRLEDSVKQARSQMEKDEGKIDELVPIYLAQTQWIWKPLEKLQRVFNRLKERDAFKLKETVVREDRKKDTDNELEAIEGHVDQMKMKEDSKIKRLSELQKRITAKISEVRKLEKEKKKRMYTSNQ